MVKFLIFELGVQELQGAAELGAEAGFVAVEAFEAAGIVAEMLIGDGGAGFCVADLELSADLGFLASDLVTQIPAARSRRTATAGKDRPSLDKHPGTLGVVRRP